MDEKGIFLNGNLERKKGEDEHNYKGGTIQGSLENTSPRKRRTQKPVGKIGIEIDHERTPTFP